MQRSLIVLMAITLLVVIFALQNSMIVHLKIWFWAVDIHTGLVLIITFAVGTFLGILSSVPRVMKKKKEIRELKEKLLQRVELPGSVQDGESSEKDELVDLPRKVDSGDPEFEDVITD